MKQLIFFAFLIILSACQFAAAQTAECPSPNGCVLITREAAIEAVENKAARAALEKEVAAKNQAIEDHKQIEQKLLVEVALKSGENTALKQNAVSDRAIIDLLLKSAKKKCLPFSVCF